MAASKTSPQRKPTRFQPRRAVRDAPAINAAAAAPATTATATPKKRNPPRPRADSARVAKNPPSPQKGRPAQRQRKKLQQALVRKVDGRDPDDAWREQANLLGLPLSSPPPPPPATMGGKGKGKAPQNDQEDHHAGGVPDGHRVDDNEVRRAECWIPNFEHRGRVRTRPAGISHCVWTAYKYLDEAIHRASLSPDELLKLPLLADVRRFQHAGGRAVRPGTPEGFRWDENLELAPLW